MTEDWKRELGKTLKPGEVRAVTMEGFTYSMYHVANGSFVHVSVRMVDGPSVYSKNHVSEYAAAQDFLGQVERGAMEEDASREALADLAEEMMGHEGIDRTYILEALISDLRGGDPNRGLRALRVDRLGRG